MTLEYTQFERLKPRTLPDQVMQLPDVDLALVWLDASPHRDFEDAAYQDRWGLLVTYQLQPGCDIRSLDALIGPGDVLQESWRGLDAMFGTARLTRSTCARWLSDAGRAVVARFETALVWRDRRGSPSADTRQVGDVELGHTWRAAPATTSQQSENSVEAGAVANQQSQPVSTLAASSDVWIVVDDGCPWARSDLRLPNGCSRLLSLWYQQAPGTPIDNSQALPHSWAGRYWDNARLNEWLMRTGHDPAAAYAAWGDEQLLHRTSHGAQILGLLLGRAGDMRPPAAPLGFDPSGVALGGEGPSGPRGPDLVFVQLPRSVRSTVSRAALTPWVLEGIAHGLEHAGPARRAVATLSLESYDGPHDGTSLFEAGIQALIDHARERLQLDLRVVLAAGNAHQRRVTAHADLEPARATDFCWELVPGSERAAWLELWCPADAPCPELQIAAPGRALSPALNAGQLWAWPSAEQAVCAVLWPAAPRAGGRLIWVRLAPTQTFQGDEPAAPCGVWRLVLTASVPMRVHGYLARVWPGPGGHGGGRQGRLWVEGESAGGPHDLQRPAIEASSGSVNGLACGGPDITVVGGTYRDGSDAAGLPMDPTLNSSAEQPVAYSGQGPARGGWRAEAPAIDTLAPSEESRCLPGLRSSGHLDGSSPRMGGTSVAVPLHARTLQGGQQPETPPP
jgi:hypothetical protein